MRFFSDLTKLCKDAYDEGKKFCKDAYDGSKELVSDIKKETKKVAKWTGQQIQKGTTWVGNTLGDVLKKLDVPTWDLPIPPLSDNPRDAKRRIKQIAENVTAWQPKVEEKASEREKTIQKTYKELYKPILNQLKEILDEELMAEIQAFIDEKSKFFENQIRDEVNTKVSPSYPEWDKLMADSNLTITKVQKYCNEVYYTADNNLLDSFGQAVNETNDYITEKVNKYNDNKEKHLNSLKESLVKLSSDEATKSEEINDLYKELAVIQFINHEAIES